MSQIYLSAAHKSSGKTTVGIGLCRALKNRGLTVQPFKKGPDYIDPLWLSRAAGKPCYNLDFFNTPQTEIEKLYDEKSALADISLVEGNKGLFDGMDLHGSDCNAAMARLLELPVILVINTQGITRGIAPLICGYQAFPGAPKIAGVILNRVAGGRHEDKLRAVVDEYTDLPVVGSIYQSSELQIDERHLGLIPSNEAVDSEKLIAAIAAQVEAQVDIDLLISLGKDKQQTVISTANAGQVVNKYRIGVFQDAAFGFYYPDDLEALEQGGAELVPINAILDSALPDIDGLFIGGGFPETHMQALADNTFFKQSVIDYIEQDGVVYAECGGLMYLAESLSWKGQQCEMCGIIPGRIVMYEKPQGRGYIKLSETDNMPWPGRVSELILAHEFHYSGIEGLPDNLNYAYNVVRGFGIDGKHDGFIYRNLLANYAHLRSVGNNRWVERFLAHIDNVSKSVREDD